MTRLVPLAALGAFLLATAPLQAQDKVGESPYFPTKIGSTWNYRIGDKKLTTKITKHEKQGDLMCALMETLVDGNSVATENIAVTKDGLVRVAYNGQKPETPILFLKQDSKKGDSWPVDTKIGAETIKGKFTRGEEDVDVPGYKGKTVTSKGEFEINGQAATFMYWFAEKKGIVKLQMALSGQEILLELEKFEEGK